jgi:hypothetical protein
MVGRNILCQRNIVKTVNRKSNEMNRNRSIVIEDKTKLPDTLIFPLRGRVIKRSLEVELQVKVVASTVIWQLPVK